MKKQRSTLLKGQQQIVELKDVAELKTKVATTLKEHRELQKKLRELENGEGSATADARTKTDTK